MNRRRRRHRRLRRRGRAGRDAAGARPALKVADPRGRAARRPRGRRVAQFYDALVKVPECAVSRTRRTRRTRARDDLDALLRAGRPGQVREHVPAPGRRHDVALARHVPALRARRFPARDRVRRRRRLADRLRRRSSRGTATPRREIGVAGDSTADLGAPRSAAYPMPAIPMTLPRSSGREGASRARRTSAADAAGAQLACATTTGPPCCGNNSCIPICPIQAKYDATVHVAQAEAAGARAVAREAVVLARRSRSPTAASPRSATSGPTAARTALTGKVFVLAAHGSRRRSCCCMSRGRERCRTAWPTRATRSAAT